MKSRLLPALALLGAGHAWAQTPTALDRPVKGIPLADLFEVKPVSLAVAMDYGVLAKPEDPRRVALDAPAELRLGNLPPGAIVSVAYPSDAPSEQLRAKQAAIESRCRGALAGGARTQATVRADGTAIINGVSLRHTLPEGNSALGAEGPCTATLVFNVSLPASLKEAPKLQVVNSATYMLKPWVRYTYQNTWPLRRIFNFQMRADGASSCSGTSLGPSNFPIGVLEHNGDLALQVRSGPAGTVCRAVSPGFGVQDRLRLISIDWEVQRSTPAGQTVKCCVADECLGRVRDTAIIGPGHLPSDNPGTFESATPQEDLARRLGVTPISLRDGQHMLGFAHAWLACDATAVNDHGVRLVLKSAEFEGPAGAEVP